MASASFFRGVKIVLDPTPQQEELMLQNVGAARFAYNTMLALVKESLQEEFEGERLGWSFYELRNHFNSIKPEVAPWYKEVSKEALASGSKSLSVALKNFSDSKKGKRKGKRVGFPRFKKRAACGSCTFETGSFRITDGNHIQLPKIGKVHTLEDVSRLQRKIEDGDAKLKAVTLKKHRGRWVAVLRVEFYAAKQPKLSSMGRAVGVDVGVKSLLVAANQSGDLALDLSRPSRIDTLFSQKALLQRQGRRKVKGSNRWRKHQEKINKLDYKIANIREDTLHKATTFLAENYETVVIEDLNVLGMMSKGRHKRGLNKLLGLSSLATIHSMLEYKVLERGGALIKAPKFYPSSKTCSSCGVVKAKLHLGERVFGCDDCHLVIDRDLNAALNLVALSRHH